MWENIGGLYFLTAPGLWVQTAKEWQSNFFVVFTRVILISFMDPSLIVTALKTQVEPWY